MRWPALPEPGGDFRAAYLANVWVKDEAPETFHALLEHAAWRLQPRGFHFFTFALDDGDALAPALRGFTARRLHFTLFAVTPGDAPRTPWAPDRTGFEVCLA